MSQPPQHASWADDVEEEEAQECGKAGGRRASSGGAAAPPPARGRAASASPAPPPAGSDDNDGDYGAAPTAVAAVDDWHPGMPVQRGAARARLDMAHGFLAGIVRNQRDRDAYEQAWQKAQAASGDDYQRKWGRAPVQRDGRDWNQ